MSLTQIGAVVVSETTTSTEKPTFITPTRIAALLIGAIPAAGLGTYELSQILYPTPEAIQALSDFSTKAVLYSATALSLVGGYGYILKETIEGFKKLFRR